jgi:Fic family protein
MSRKYEKYASAAASTANLCLAAAHLAAMIARDGGQAARLYCMSRQLQENQSAYYDVLNAAQTGNLDITVWIVWFVTQFGAACQ